MSHHSSQDLPPEVAKHFLEQFRLGPTDRFPEGKLTEADEGEIQVGVTHYAGKVILNFGAPVRWIGFTPEQAREIAVTLFDHAEELS